MKITFIYSACVMLLVFASCKKDEYVRNDDIPDYTVKLQAGIQPMEYFLYDDAHLFLDATTPGAISYLWQPGNETSSIIEFIPNQFLPAGYTTTDTRFAGCYEVTVTLPDTICVYRIVVFMDESVVYCANSFVPNGDWINDYWTPFYNFNAVTINGLNIFSSTNKRVFHSSGNEIPAWDGKYNGIPCQCGTYYYTIHYTSAQGKKKSKEDIVFLMCR